MINQLFKIRYLFYFLLVGLANCNFSASKEIPSPAGYRFSDGQKIFLRSSLEEVSGISFVPGSDSVLMAVNDEEGKIFSVNIFDAKAKVEPFRFSDRGDYEDVAFYSGYWRILESKGIIHSVNMNEGKIPEPLKILPKGEYEGMAAENGNLYVACKDCPKDKDYTSTIYSFSTSGDSLVLQKVFVLDATEFLKGKKKKVLPSALAKNP
nr:hypothetical protein [Chitinophagaceae bacterium]